MSYFRHLESIHNQLCELQGAGDSDLDIISRQSHITTVSVILVSHYNC